MVQQESSKKYTTPPSQGIAKKASKVKRVKESINSWEEVKDGVKSDFLQLRQQKEIS